jgi:pentatricopeptide repeat protein
VERVIRRVVHEQRAGNAGVQSFDMAAMYTQAIRGWANSWEKGPAAQRAEEILDTMQRRYMDGDDRIKPEIECFNLVLLAYSRSGLPDAPQQALRVLDKLNQWHAEGATDAIPTSTSYATILQAFSKTGKPEAPEQVKRLLEHLEQLSEEEGYSGVRPNYMCKGAYLSALVNAMEQDHITGTEAAEKAEEYLFQMLKSPYEEDRPDSFCFHMVLSAWSRSGSLKMVERAEAVMKEFEDYHERTGRAENTKPLTNSYNCLIACYSRSRSPDAGEMALDLLRKMQSLAKNEINPSVFPDVVSYNSVMAAYAKSKQRDAPYKVEQLLREMHELYEETGDMLVRPNIRSLNTCVSQCKLNVQCSEDHILTFIFSIGLTG